MRCGPNSVIVFDAGLCLTLISSAASSLDGEGAARPCSGCSGGLPLPGELPALMGVTLSHRCRCCTGLKLHGTHATPHGCGR